MVCLHDMNDDEGRSTESTRPPPATPKVTVRRREARGVPAPAVTGADTTFYNPAQVAKMWGISHDKVLEFIKTGELEAFNVASKKSRRPQFKIPGSALRAFQERRSARCPVRSMIPPAPRRAASKMSRPTARRYF